MEFIAIYNVEYNDEDNPKKSFKIREGTIVDIDRIFYGQRIGTKYILKTGESLSAEVFNSAFEEYKPPANPPHII